MNSIGLKQTLAPTKSNQLIISALSIILGSLISVNVFAVSPNSAASKADLAAEVAARKAADAAEANARQAGDSAEASARQSADSAESSARQAADAQLQEEIALLQRQINQLSGFVDYFNNPPDHETVIRYCPNTQEWQNTPCTYSIGARGPAGGIVFYVDSNGINGLEASLEDQSAGAIWCFPVQAILGLKIVISDATIPGLNDDNSSGAYNTPVIASACGPNSAAGIAASYKFNGYTDWFLPNKQELNLLYQQRNLVGGFAAGQYYWSSSQSQLFVVTGFAWYTIFDDGGTNFVNFQDSRYRVRAIRAF